MLSAYIRSKKIEIILLSIWIVILYTYKIFFHVIGVDTEQALLDFESNLNWTLGSGRFVSAFLRKICMPKGFHYDFAVLLTIAGWLAVCIAYLYCLERMGMIRRWCGLFFSMLFVACPIWAEQSYFVCAAFVNVYGILLTIIAAYLLVYNRQEFQMGYAVASIILGVFAIGIYQALFYLLLANCAVFLSLDAYGKDERAADYLVSGIRCIGMIAVSAVIYVICAKAAVHLFYDPSFDYAGFTDAEKYLSAHVKWLDGNILKCAAEIRSYILDSCSPDDTYGMPFYPLLFAVVQIYSIVRAIKKEEQRYRIILIGNSLLLLCAFAGCLLMGGSISVREQVVLPFAAAFYSMFLLNEIADMRLEHETLKKSISILMVCISSFSVMLWGVRQLQINHSDYIRYCADVDYAEEVMNEIASKMGNYSSRKIVFLGQNQWSLPEYYDQGEVIGYSLFSWDAGGPVGVNYRAYGFLYACGYLYVKPTMEEVKEIQTISSAGEMFGDFNRVTEWNDMIVVNLDHF